MQATKDYKKIIANNIVFLMNTYNVNRKELCESTGIKYTTLCDWLNAVSYPRIDSLEKIAGFFSLEVPQMFIEIDKDEKLLERTLEYARRFAMKKDYKDTYPGDFWDLFGTLSGSDITEPEDTLPKEVEL